MDDVTDLVERFADRGQPRGAQRVLDDARRGTVALERQSPPSLPRRRARVAIAALAGVGLVGAAFLAGRNNSQPDPTDRGSATVLDNVTDADATQLCQALAPLAERATQSRGAIDFKTTASVAEDYRELAEQARQIGAVAFATALAESGEQLALLTQPFLDSTGANKPTTTMQQAQFRLALLRLRRSDAELELACAARGHDPVLAQLTDSSDTPTTSATR